MLGFVDMLHLILLDNDSLCLFFLEMALEFVDWVLLQCGLSYTICEIDEDHSLPVPAVDSVHEAPAAMPTTEHKPQSAADSEPETATIIEPKLNKDVKSEPTTNPVPSGAKSNQVCEPAINTLMELTHEARIFPELKPERKSGQMCEPVPVSIPVVSPCIHSICRQPVPSLFLCPAPILCW